MAKAQTLAKILWLSAGVLVLVWWVTLYGLSEQTPETLKSEAMVYVVIAMALLAFPIGLVWTILVAIAARLLHGAGIDIQSAMWASLLFYWMSALILGYVQWFVVIPHLRARKRAS